MNASFEEAISDFSALNEIAEAAGVTPDVAKKIAAEFAGLPIRQAIQICVAAQEELSGRSAG